MKCTVKQWNFLKGCQLYILQLTICWLSSLILNLSPKLRRNSFLEIFRSRSSDRAVVWEVLQSANLWNLQSERNEIESLVTAVLIRFVLTSLTIDERMWKICEWMDSGNPSVAWPARIPRELSWNQTRNFETTSRRLFTWSVLRQRRTVARIWEESNLEC